jgi:DUF4097 and DUF4098 domain-containing protein YvlB
MKVMSRKHGIRPLAIWLFGLAIAGNVNAGSINKSITIEAGSESRGESSVNGSINVGRGATVTGSLKTVNGEIRIDDDAIVEDLQTVNGSIKLGSNAVADDISGVNGSIRLGENSTVNGEVSVVNGKISSENGSRISRDVRNVNGELQIVATRIGGDLTTVNGDVLLTDASTLSGNLTVEKPSGWNWNKKRVPQIVIGPGSVVEGEIRLERKVELYIHETASVSGVTGVMSMDDAVRFSGNRP